MDAVCRALLEAGVGADDVVVDGGNSLYTDTERRAERAASAPWLFVGMGVSGGAGPRSFCR